MKKTILKNRLLALTALFAFSMGAPQILPDAGYGMAYAQTQQTIQGVVKDSQGEPLIGAGVLIKGSSNGTVTDADGKFTMTAQSGQILEVSYIGFVTKEIKVDGKFFDITLEEDNNLLDEVVVIGYGTLARKDISSSISTVSSKDFNSGSYTSPAQLLQGKVAGLTVTQSGDPNGGGSISLRGASSLRDGSAMEPYYIIDGIPGVSLSLVSPDDIETIDVLRDASATAIYGSKAANGVIIVTTKKGSREGRVAVNYSGYASWDKAIKQLDVMTADELREYAKTNNFTLPNDLGANTNWQDEVLQVGFGQNHNVSVSGGGSKAQYSASLNYYKKDGVIKTSGTERLTARSFVQAKAFNDHLEVSASVNASIHDNNWFVTNGGSSESPLFSMYSFSPLCPVKNEDGTWYDGTGVVSQNFNPMSTLYENTSHSKSKTIQGVGKVAATIIDGLVINLTGSYQNNQYLYDMYGTHNSQLTNVASKNGLASRSENESSKKQLEAYVTYDKLFRNNHKLGVMAGYSWEQNDDGDGFGLSAYNFYDDSTTWYNFNLANSFNVNDIYSYQLSTLRMISFYGRVNYSFDSRYIFQATIRRDGSSAFGTNNRWGTFPSASAAWRIIQEPWMKNQKAFSDLKFRVGYGVSGNSLGFDAFTARETYGPSSWFDYTDAQGQTARYRTIVATNNANPDLKWERTAMLNIGLDFGFFNNRLTGTIEFYNKETSDLIYWYPVSTNRYPYGTMTANVGNINNKGVEVTLRGTPVQKKNFSWNTSLILSHNKNNVTKMSNDIYSTDYINMAYPGVGGFSSQCVMRLEEGSPIGTFYVYEWAGYNEAGISQYNDYDADGNLIGTTISPGEEDRVKKGCAQPKMTLGWDNTFSYKGWSLTAFFQGTFGNDVYNCTRNYFSNVTLAAIGKNALASIMTEQKYTDSNAQCPSDRYLEKGDFFRLSNLQLSYQFGKLGKWLNGLQLYITGNNIFTITNYSGTDPEVYLGGLTPGMDNQETRYPLTRSILLGAKINF